MSDEQDDKERGEWLHALSHIHEGEHAELEFARTWADSVEVDYDEGPCAIGFTKNGATYWYLIDDVGWDADDPRSEMLAAALAERNDLRTQLTIALRERDEARVECERLRGLLPTADEIRGLRALHFDGDEYSQLAERYADRAVAAFDSGELAAPLAGNGQGGVA